jgi:hypothetical protein
VVEIVLCFDHINQDFLIDDSFDSQFPVADGNPGDGSGPTEHDPRNYHI